MYGVFAPWSATEVELKSWHEEERIEREKKKKKKKGRKYDF